MAKKSSKNNGSRSVTRNTAADKKAEVLQAVVIADDFDGRFSPLTSSVPRSLLPLANVPMIEYTLEALSSSGVEEAFLYCRNNVDTFRTYIQNSRWMKRKSTMKVKVEVAASNNSVGDILRDVDAKGLILDTFLLVHGDLVCNVPLREIVMKHKAISKSDPNLIMTSLLRPCKPFHRTRDRCEGAVFTLDKVTGQMLAYDRVESEQTKKNTTLSASLFSKFPHIDIRYDLLDCDVDVCSLQVLALFEENFDYQDIRRDLINGVLTSDILGHTLYCHILKDGYAARVKSPHLYDSISKDIMNRWSYPLVPDSNISDSTTFAFKRGMIYKEMNVVLSRTCVIGTCVVLGSGTIVGENVYISNSVIGRNCRISDNVRIEGSYIWDNSIIESNASIERSIISYGVNVKTHAKISKGCILDQQVVIGSEVRLEPFSKISRVPQGLCEFEEEDDDERAYGDVDVFDNSAYDSEIVGEDGQGFIWRDNYNAEVSDDECEADREYETFVLAEKLEASKLASEYNDRKYTIASQYSVEENETCDELSDEEDFDKELDLKGFKLNVLELIKSSISGNHSLSDTMTEVNAFKMATDAKHRAMTITNYDCLQAVVPAICSFIKVGDLQKSTESVLNGWHALISRFMDNATDQKHLMDIISCYCSENAHIAPATLIIFHSLYDKDILEEEIIKEWFNSSRPLPENVKDEVRKLIDWLDTAEEDDDDDDED